MKHRFFICSHCGNLATLLIDKGVPLVCCGEKMTELTANTVEASAEKHLPAVTSDGDTVTVSVGSVAHPMEEKHFIVFIYLETDKGAMIKELKPGDEPKAVFAAGEAKAVAAYAYCNLHGLWKTAV